MNLYLVKFGDNGEIASLIHYGNKEVEGFDFSLRSDIYEHLSKRGFYIPAYKKYYGKYIIIDLNSTIPIISNVISNIKQYLRDNKLNEILNNERFNR